MVQLIYVFIIRQVFGLHKLN